VNPNVPSTSTPPGFDYTHSESFGNEDTQSHTEPDESTSADVEVSEPNVEDSFEMADQGDHGDSSIPADPVEEDPPPQEDPPSAEEPMSVELPPNVDISNDSIQSVPSPPPVRKVLKIVPTQSQSDSESKRKSPELEAPQDRKESPPKKKSQKKMDPPVEPPKSTSPIEAVEIAPVLGRKTKQKKFKAPTFKKKSQPAPVPPAEELPKEPPEPETTVSPEKAAVETEVTKPAESKFTLQVDLSDYNQATQELSLDLNDFIAKIEHMQLLSKTLTDLVQVLETESTNSDEFIRRFEGVAQSMTPAQFVESALNPLITTAHRLVHALRIQHKKNKDSESKNIRGSPWTSDQWYEQLTALQKVVGDLQESRDVLMHIHEAGHKDADFDSGSDLESVDQNDPSEDNEPKLMSPERYLQGIVYSLYQLVRGALSQPIGKYKGRKFKAKKLLKADPLYCLAAATGLSPNDIVNMNTAQRRRFVDVIQREYPDPVRFISSILETGHPVHFNDLYLMCMDNAIAVMSNEVAALRKEEARIKRRLDEVRERNEPWKADVEKILGVRYPSDEEWIDED
jgi:hypothetical protein